MQNVDRTETSLRANAYYSAKIIRRRNPGREYVERVVDRFGVSDISLKASEVQLGEGFRTKRSRCARDPFDFAQGRLFTSPEERLRPG